MNNYTVPSDAKVVELTGSVVSGIDIQHLLTIGASVNANTVIALAEDSQLTLLFEDGSQQVIGYQELNPAETDSTVKDPSLDPGDQVDSLLQEIEDIQSQIDSGDNFDTQDTAAGGDQGNEGTGFTKVERNGDETIASAGVDSAPLTPELDSPANPQPDGQSNQPTITTPDQGTSPEDTPVTGNVLVNDSDADDALSVVSFSIAGDPTRYNAGDNAVLNEGTLTIAADGGYRFIPNENFNGVVPQVTYTTNTNAAETLDISITPVDDPSSLADDTATTPEDTAVVIDVLANDSDIDGAVSPVDTFTQGSNGTVSLNPDGTLTYTPNPDFNGQDSFTYTNAEGNTASVTVNVTPVDDPSSLADDTATTPEDTAVVIDVLANDSDIDGAVSPVDTFTQGSNGTVSLNPDGTLTYTPNPDFNGQDSFTYTNAEGNTASVTVNVTPVDDPSSLADDTATTPEDTAVVIDVLANDSDIDGAVSPVDTFTQGSNGTVSLNPDGTLTYTPNANFNGQDSFTYTNAEGNTASVTVNVTPVDDPSSLADDTATTPEDTAVVIDVLANDSDIDGAVSPVDTFSQGSNGTVSLNPDGTLTYTPNANFNGQDSFTYTNAEGNTASVTVNVTPVDDPSSLADDTATTPEDTAVVIDVLANDSDIDGAVSPVDTFSQGSNGTVSLNPDGTLTYTPNANFNGQDSFTYTNAEGNTATVTVNVTPVDDPSSLADDTATTPEDTAVVIDVLANDSDIDGAVSPVDTFTQGSNGTVSLNPDGTLTYTPNGNFNGQDTFTYTNAEGNTATVTVDVTPTSPSIDAVDDSITLNEDTSISASVAGNDNLGETPSSFTLASAPTSGSLVFNADGSYTYTPNANFNGFDSFTYTITDSDGQTDTATVSITVTPVNDAPETNNTSASGTEDSAGIAVSLSGSDSDGTVASFTIESLPANGTLMLNGVALKVGDSVPASNNGATLTFKPNANWHGDTSFTFASVDNQGLTDASPAKADITVTPVNDAPETNNTSASGTEDSAGIAVSLSGSDSDGTVASFTIESLPANGTLMLNGVALTIGSTVPATGNGATLTFVPNANWHGDTSFTFASVDNQGLSDTTPATADITVTPVNDAPETNNTSASGTEDSAGIAVSLSGSDSDGTVASFTIESLPANGTLMLNGVALTIGSTVPATGNGATLTFKPNANWHGDTSFTFASVDNQGLSDTTPATADITVTPVNDAPETNNTSASGTEDSAGIAVSLSGSDSDGTVASFTIESLPANGTLMLNGVALTIGSTVPATGNGATLTFKPNANWHGDTSFTYASVDNDGLKDLTPATADITVTPVNDAPIAENDSFSVAEGGTITGNVISQDDGDGIVDADQEGDALTVTAVNGQLLSTYTQNASGEYEVPIQVAGERPGTLSSTGTLYIKADGSFRYENDGYLLGSKSPSFEYTISDGSLTDSASVTIDVTASAPVAHDDTNYVASVAPIITGNILNKDNGSSGDVSDEPSEPGGSITLTQVSYAGVDYAISVGSNVQITTKFGFFSISSSGDYMFFADYQAAKMPSSMSFDYTIQDDDGVLAETDTGRLTIDFTDIPDSSISSDAGVLSSTIDTSLLDNSENTQPSLTGKSELSTSDLFVSQDGDLDALLVQGGEDMPEVAQLVAVNTLETTPVTDVIDTKPVINGLLDTGALAISDDAGPVNVPLTDHDTPELI